MTAATIDPQTLMLVGIGQRSFTAPEFAAIEAPPCPVCGTTVTIERIDVTWNAEEEALHGRTYVPGMWQCPRYCNPKTGKRWHDWTAEFGGTGNRFRCNCGTDEYPATVAELNALMTSHQN